MLGFAENGNATFTADRTGNHSWNIKPELYRETQSSRQDELASQ